MLAPFGRDADGRSPPRPVPRAPPARTLPSARPVRAIDDDAQAVEATGARQRPLGGVDIAVVHAVHAAGRVGRSRQRARARWRHRGRCPRSRSRGLPRPRPTACSHPGPEELDAIVELVGVVAGRDHHAQIGAQRQRASIATAGVGIGPTSTTSIPAEAKPATMADSTII